MRSLLIIPLVIILFSCKQANERDKPLIAVSILPQKYLLESLVDTLADVMVMVPPGANPATWEATPAQMAELGEADAYFRIGHIGFEKAWMDNIAEINPDMKITDLSKGIDLLKSGCDHGEHGHGAVDPHIWMSARRMELMAARAHKELTGIFPEYKPLIDKNYIRLYKEIKATAASLSSMLSEYRGESFLIFHPSLTYFADEYGLEQLAIELEGKEPSPSHMRSVIDAAREKGIKTIFVQKEFDRRNAAVIAREIGAEVVVIDPLSEKWPEEMALMSLRLISAFGNE